MLKILSVVALLAASPALAAPPLPPDTYRHPAQLVSLLDGRKMNLLCLGEGSPVVVLDAGYGSGASTWAAIHPILAETTKVCAFDRPGNEWSDPGPLPRTTAAIVADERAMLKAAGLKGPFVLVGHSMAGLDVRLYASLYPKEVAGVVMIDPSNPHQQARLAEVAPASAAADAARMAGRRKCAEQLIAGELKAGDDPDFAKCFPPPPSSVPEPWRSTLANRQTDPKRLANLMSEVDSMPGADSDQIDAAKRPLGDLPLIVLTAEGTARGLAGSPGEQAAAAQVWSQMHDEAAALSTRGENRHVDADHYVWFKRPDAVIGAVVEVVQAARANAAAKGRH
jgi:pimeloyl-ACP methyl ester carboxylesterase